MSDYEAISSRVASPEEAFSVLGDDVRLSILLELTRAASEQGSDAALSFSELRRRVDVEDSGRFNYHLNRLTGDFVRDDDDGYRARYPGLQVVSTIYAGLYSEPDRTSVESEYDCPNCERPLEITYQDLSLTLQCVEHGRMVDYPAPPGALEGRTLPELMTVVFKRAMSEVESAIAGICQRCWGTAEVGWPVEPPVENEMHPDDRLWVEIACDRCWLNYKTTYRTVIAAHPAVRGFYTSNGYDQVAVFAGSNPVEAEEVCSVTVHDDRRVTTTIELEDTLSITLDEAFNVLEQTRDRSG